MLSFLPAPVLGALAGILFLINILIIAILIVLVGLIELIIPIKPIKNFLLHLQNNFFTIIWTDINTGILKLVTKTKWVVNGEGSLSKKHWYFVISNHQTWADIIVLQRVFNHKIPMLKFFLKKELLWSLPMGGLACWMLDFPFMQRHSKAYLKKHPEKKTADLDTTLAACSKFKQRPTTVMNFLEGTRFTPEKQKDRSSPYKHLLRPKAGGLAFVVSEMKDFIKEVVDVTIIYDHPNPTFWNLLCGRIPRITINYNVIEIAPELYGDYYNDPVFRRQFQGWVNSLWKQKDDLIHDACNSPEQPSIQQHGSSRHEDNSANCHP